LAKVHNGLHHHISIIEMVREHIWIISFGARTKKTPFRGADPAETGQASSQSGQAGLANFVQCKNVLHHCISIIELVKKPIWIALF
jgi:hypothetical protein